MPDWLPGFLNVDEEEARKQWADYEADLVRQAEEEELECELHFEEDFK